MPQVPIHSDDVLVWVIVVLVGLVFTAMAAMVFLLKQRQNGNGNGKHKSGELSPETWEIKIRAIIKDEIENTFKEAHKMRGNMRSLAAAIQSHNRDFIDEMCEAVKKSCDE